MNTKHILSYALTATLLASFAQDTSANPKWNKPTPPPGNYKVRNVTEIPDEYQQYIHASEEDLRWWRNAKFGVFVHWGPSSLSKVPIGWGRQGKRPGHSSIERTTGGAPEEEYDTNYERFDPIHFNADEWVQMVKTAGAKYLVFTSKHHDGFCMFDSAHTEYDMMSTPFQRDICKELAEACHKHNIKLLWYYSQPDWHHPDYWTDNHDDYIAYLHNQLEELTTKYGRIDGIWFDGLGKNAGTWDGLELLRKLRTNTPGMLINSRLANQKDRWGDWDTPEQRIGTYQTDYPWESCMTMGRAWSWLGEGGVKSYEWCLRTLIRCAGGGGNLLLNTGPRPDGKINPPEAENYKRMGQWLNQFGESIYGTRGGPYKPGPWGVSCHKENKIYLHVLQHLERPGISLPLPGDASILDIYSLTGEEVVYKSVNGWLHIGLNGIAEPSPDRIIVIELDQPADQVAEMETKPELISRNATASASSSDGKKYTIENLSGSGHTVFTEGAQHQAGWRPQNKDAEPWVVLDLGETSSFSQIQISEKGDDIRSFTLEYSNDGDTYSAWHNNTRLGDFSLKTKPVTARYVRLTVTDKSRRPTILSMDVYK